MFLIFKSLHIIFIVTWFAGLFYMVRLMVYLAEANELAKVEKKETDQEKDRSLLESVGELKRYAPSEILIPQYKLMGKRLWYGITWPSAILTLFIAPQLLVYYWPLTSHPWLLWKLVMVFFLYLYHFKTHLYWKELVSDKSVKSSQFFRYWNEGATLFLVSVVFLVVLKSIKHMFWGISGLLAFTFLLIVGIRTYRKTRLAK